MSIRAVIFDMDGTILNTLEDLADSMNHCLSVYGMPQRSLEEIRCFVGNGIHKLVERAVPEGTSGEMMEAVYDTFLRWYRDHCALRTRPYDGIPEVLRELADRGILTAVVSNKADAAVKLLTQEYFPGLFHEAAGDLPGRRRKPWPDSLRAVMEQLGVTAEETVYVGDSEVDHETAVRAGVREILVAWGFREEELLHSLGAETVIHAPEELLRELGLDGLPSGHGKCGKSVDRAGSLPI